MARGNVIKKRPIAEQIAEYENEIKRIDIRIENGRAKQRELRKIIRKLQTPEAEQRWKRTQQQRIDREWTELRKQELHELKRARMERQIQECLRMNGKIL